MKTKMMKCKACGAEIAKSAKACPHCGAKTHQGAYIAVAVISVVAVFAVVLCIVQTFTGNQPSNKDDARTDAIEISAQDLWKAYADNEVSADSLYKDKTLSVTGTISNIGKDIIFDTPCVSLSTGDQFGLNAIQCFFPKEDNENEAIMKLQNGQTITIIGTCTGTPVTNVQLSACSLNG